MAGEETGLLESREGKKGMPRFKPPFPAVFGLYGRPTTAGSGLGSGVVIVMDDTTCVVRLCQRIARFYMAESRGQCTPCREGTGWMHRVLSRVIDGEATIDDLHRLKAIAGRIEGHTICAFGEAAAWPVQALLHHYWAEFEYFVTHKHSMVESPS